MITPVPQAAGTQVQSNTVDISPAWPTHQVGDIALLLVQNRNNTVTLSTPAGFVEVPNSPQGTGTPGTNAAVRLAVYWCRATSAAMAAPVITFPGGHHQGCIITFRNCVESGVPYDVTAGDVLATPGTAVSIPGLVTTLDKCLIAACIANEGDIDGPQVSGWTNADLANVLEFVDENSLLGLGGGIAVATGEKAVAGAVGATAATLAGASNQGRITIALKGRRAPLLVGVGTQASAGGPHNGEDGHGPIWPTHVVGDVALMLVESDNEPLFFDDAAGFELLASIGVGDHFDLSTKLWVYWCRATSTSMPNPVLTFPNPTAGAGYDHWIAQILTFRGCPAQGLPWNVAVSDTQDLTILNFAVPGGVTTVDNCLVLAISTNSYDISVNNASGWTNADLAELVEVLNITTSFGKGGSIAAATGRKATAGAYAATTGTWQLASDTAGQAQARMSIALLPDDAPRAASPSPTAKLSTRAFSWRQGPKIREGFVFESEEPEPSSNPGR